MAIGSIGVPVGTQAEAPLITASGTPPPITRTAPVSHCPVAQGGVGVPVSAQPAMMYGLAIVTAGCPDRSTRGKGVVGVACPAWLHSIVAPKWRMGAGIAQTTVSAPRFTSTVGPVSEMVAPLPLEMTMPTSLTEIIAPVVVWISTPPVGPGTSLTTMPFFSAV